MFSSHSTLSFSSTELNPSHHYRAPFRPRNHPKSRSKLHHHHHHHHHHPSWSSSLSAFSLHQQQPHHQQQQQQHHHHHHHHHQRASGFLIDEYGNEHDPEHCRFKTLATVRQTRRHSRSSSSSTTTTTSSSSSASSLRSTSSASSSSRSSPSSSSESRPSQPTSPSSTSHWTRPSPHPIHSYHTLPPPSTVGPATRWSSLKPRPKKLSSSSPSWPRTLWAHLRPSPPPASPPVTTYALHQAAHPIFSLPREDPAPASHNSPFLRSFPRPPVAAHNPHHLSAVRRRLELVKLEVRFGILRTRKRLVGVWKQQTGCKKL